MSARFGVRVTAIVILLLVAADANSAAASPSSPGAVAALAQANPLPSTISYQGHLTDAIGNPLSGSHDFVFQFWDDPAAGSQVGGDIVVSGVPVTGGVFSVALDVSGIGFRGNSRWLRISVDGQWMSPRQALLPAPYALGLQPGASSAGAVSGAVFGAFNYAGPEQPFAYGVWGDAGATFLDAPLYHAGVLGTGSAQGVVGNATGNEVGSAGGVFTGRTGVRAAGGDGPGGDFSSAAMPAVRAETAFGYAIEAYSGTVPDVWAVTAAGMLAAGEEVGVSAWGGSTGLEGWSETGNGVAAGNAGSGAEGAALRVSNTNANHGMAAYFTNNSDYGNAHLQNSGNGEVLVLQNNGGRFLRAVDAGWDAKFRLDADGRAYADESWIGGGADYAEMMPGVAGLEPGDVLVIGADGSLVRSTGPFQANAAGVYSSRPGFVAGDPIEGGAPGTIPLAVVGVVPVKASAENGAIRAGDLLVTASEPGTAMRAGVDPPQGTVIGKALEALCRGTGTVKMLAALQ